MKRKRLSFGVALVVVVFGYIVVRSLTSTVGEVRYITAQVVKGTVISSITGSGQVSVSDQVDVKAKASGDIVYVGVKVGQEVKAGTLLVHIDARDAAKTVRDAQANLASAQLSYDKLLQPVDALSLTQAENTLAQAQESKQKAQDDLIKSHDDGFTAIANAFLDLPTVMAGLQNILSGSDRTLGGPTLSNVDYYANAVSSYDYSVIRYRDDVNTKYAVARLAYDANFDAYKATSRFADATTVEALIQQTYTTTKSIAEAIKSANNLIQFYEDKVTQHGGQPQTTADTHVTSLNSYTSKTNGHLSSLLNIENTIQGAKDTIVNADRTIDEKTQSLAKLRAGTDPLDLQSQKIALQQRINALADAQEKLADYYVHAPFDGVVATMNMKKGDTVSSGTVISTFITKQKIATLSLNEVDAAKVRVGQKVTLTFDAVSDLIIAGQVIEIDTLGTVTQGVVTYTVTIGFDTQDERVKPGMSVSAAIITNMKQDVLIAPNSAIKTQNQKTYVEMFDVPLVGSDQNNQGVTSSVLPRQQTVEVGIANDTQTEIINGLKEGDQVVVRTITTSSTNTSTAPSAMSALGGARAGASGGAAFRGAGAALGH